MFNEIAKKVVGLGFDFLENKYGDSLLVKSALSFVEKILLQAIDDGLVDFLTSKQAFTAPEQE